MREAEICNGANELNTVPPVQVHGVRLNVSPRKFGWGRQQRW